MSYFMVRLRSDGWQVLPLDGAESAVSSSILTLLFLWVLQVEQDTRWPDVAISLHLRLYTQLNSDFKDILSQTLTFTDTNSANHYHSEEIKD